jgi:hypothetical protein
MTRALMLIAISAALTGQTPVRETPLTPPRGTAHISGVVVTDDAAAAPVRLATVRLRSGALAQTEMLSTDDEGRFDFANLPAGRFSLIVEKAGYVETEYGAANSRSSGIPIVVGAGEAGAVTVRLPRGGVITGTIAGPDGEPAQGVHVWLLRNLPDQYGGLSMQIDGPSGWRGQPSTNDRGVYRFYGLTAGDYFVAAAPDAQGGRQVTTAELDWANRLLHDPASANPLLAPPPGRSASYASVFFPGTPDPAGAVAVSVAKGQERAGVDFTLQYQPTATLSGTALDPNGLPPVNVQANLLTPAMSVFLTSPGNLRFDADGTFVARSVVPGAYVLAIRATANPKGDPSAPVQPGSLLWARVNLAVDGRDQDNIDVRLQPGMAVSGRVAFDGVTIKPPDDLSRVRVSLQVVSTPQTVSISTPASPVNGDGSFTVTGVVPGQYRLAGTPPAPAGAGAPAWTLRSAIVDGRDVLDHPMEVREGQDVSGAVVTFTDHPTELTGSFVDASGKPAPQYTLIVFSTDRSLWITGTRRVRVARPGNNGEFRVVGLAPGDYYLAAVGDLDQTVLYTPAFLESLGATALKVTLAEGEKKVQDVRNAPGRER